MTLYGKNLILTLAILGAVVYLAATGSKDVALALIPAVLLLWRRSGRKNDGALLLMLAMAGCTWSLSWSPPWGAQGLATDHLSITPQASNPIASGKAGLYAKSSDNLVRMVDTTGNEYVAGTGWRLRQSAGVPSGVAMGDVWYNTSTNVFAYRDNSGTVTLPSDGLVVHLAGSETLSGAKTFSAAAVFNGAVTLGDAAADAIAVKGALAIDNATNTYAVTLTHAATANRSVTLPDAAGAVVLDTAPQTLTNKSISGPQINSGDIAAARIATALSAPGAIGGGTPAAGTFTVLAANTSLSVAGAPTVATFFKTCTITSAAAATPVNCLSAADVPAALSAKLGHWHAKVNGATAWTVTATCTIEDTAGNDLVVIPVADLTGNNFISNHSAALTYADRYALGTGGAADAGLQIVCNANGATGSDLVVVLMGTVQ